MKAKVAPVDPQAVAVSPAFRQAFAYLTRHHGWAGDELEEVRQACRSDIGMRCYLVLLAQMKRDHWYAQNAANGFIRLDAFMGALGRDMAAEHAALVQEETKRLAAKRAVKQLNQERNSHVPSLHQSKPARRFAGRRTL